MSAEFIYKYPLAVIDFQEIKLPAGAQILSLQVQREIPCIWALVDPKAELRTHHISTYGTGYGTEAYSGKYIGTYQLKRGEFVFHVFDKS